LLYNPLYNTCLLFYATYSVAQISIDLDQALYVRLRKSNMTSNKS